MESFITEPPGKPVSGVEGHIWAGNLVYRAARENSSEVFGPLLPQSYFSLGGWDQHL